MTAFLQRFLNVRRDEVAALLVSAAFFFCVLSALMILRPARDALGMKRGMDDIRWLFVGTALVTLVAIPAFGWLVSRFRRITFISATYGFFAVSLAGFYVLLTRAPNAVGETSGMVFYVWFSVFNLFCTMVFWALMVDRFTLEQSKRLFGAIAVGGTLGAINGPWLAGLLAEPLGTPALLLVAAGFLVVAVAAAWVVAWLQPEHVAGEPSSSDSRTIIGGSAWDGIRAVFRSRYLLGISGYMLVLSVIATFIYFTRLKLVADLGDSTDLRATALANIDLATQVATLALQLVVAGHFMRRLGVSAALILLPIVVMIGFLSLAALTESSAIEHVVTVALGFFAVTVPAVYAALVIFDATFRAVQRAIMRPARETLFTVVSREDKYKSKAFTDTFVYRGGDVIGAWTEGFLGQLGLGLAGLASAAVPLAMVWGVLGLWLGRRQEALASSRAEIVPLVEPLAAQPLPEPVK
jgi:AAA family ATP:ADP antiporter